MRLVGKLRLGPHPLSSHQYLEVLVNLCLLEQLRGRTAKELITEQPQYKGQSFGDFVGGDPLYLKIDCLVFLAALSMLTQEDLQILCLVYIHLTYVGTIPTCLLATPTSGYSFPVRVVSKVCQSLPAVMVTVVSIGLLFRSHF